MPYNLIKFKSDLTSKLKGIGYDMNAQSTIDYINANVAELNNSNDEASTMSIPVYLPDLTCIYIDLEQAIATITGYQYGNSYNYQQ